MKTRSTTEACRPWRDRLLSALDAERMGREDAATQAALAAHLEHCPGCASELAALRRTLARLADYQPPAPPEEYWPSLRASVLRGLVVQPGDAPRRSPLLPRLAWSGLAAAGLLLLALVFWGERRPEPTGGQSPRLAAAQPALQDLSAELAANAGQLEALIDEGQVLAMEEDPDLLLEQLSMAELAELAERLDGLRG